MSFLLHITFLSLTSSITALKLDKCRDTDMNCAEWVVSNRLTCDETGLVTRHCPRMCQICGKPIHYSGGQSSVARRTFLLYQKFTYGEQIDISISDIARNSTPSLNYTAFAWDISAPESELVEIHSENGYITASEDPKTGKTIISLTTAMSNGFMTVEEAVVGPSQLRFRLVRIGRINFSHDSAVRLMFREWTLLDEERLESRLLMTTTVTRKLMEHTFIIYRKIYP